MEEGVVLRRGCLEEGVLWREFCGGSFGLVRLFIVCLFVVCLFLLACSGFACSGFACSGFAWFAYTGIDPKSLTT